MSHPSPQSLCTGLIRSFKDNSNFALCVPNLSSISWNTMSILWWWLWPNFKSAIHGVQRGQMLLHFTLLTGNKSHDYKCCIKQHCEKEFPKISMYVVFWTWLSGDSVGMAMNCRYFLEIPRRIWSSVVLWNSEVFSVAAATHININSYCAQKDCGHLSQ